MVPLYLFLFFSNFLFPAVLPLCRQVGGRSDGRRLRETNRKRQNQWHATPATHEERQPSRRMAGDERFITGGRQGPARRSSYLRSAKPSPGETLVHCRYWLPWPLSVSAHGAICLFVGNSSDSRKCAKVLPSRLPVKAWSSGGLLQPSTSCQSGLLKKTFNHATDLGYSFTAGNSTSLGLPSRGSKGLANKEGKALTTACRFSCRSPSSSFTHFQ